jgi:hypothetical protein
MYHPPSAGGGGGGGGGGGKSSTTAAVTAFPTLTTSPRSIKATIPSSKHPSHVEHPDDLEHGDIAQSNHYLRFHHHRRGSFSSYFSQSRQSTENQPKRTVPGILQVPCLECQAILKISEKNTAASSVVYCQTCGTMASAELMRSIAHSSTGLGNRPEE